MQITSDHEYSQVAYLDARGRLPIWAGALAGIVGAILGVWALDHQFPSLLDRFFIRLYGPGPSYYYPPRALTIVETLVAFAASAMATATILSAPISRYAFSSDRERALVARGFRIVFALPCLWAAASTLAVAGFWSCVVVTLGLFWLQSFAGQLIEVSGARSLPDLLDGKRRLGFLWSLYWCSVLVGLLLVDRGAFCLRHSIDDFRWLPFLIICTLGSATPLGLYLAIEKAIAGDQLGKRLEALEARLRDLEAA